MDIYPGCSEQQIHRDGYTRKEMKDLYMFIPLMNHNKDIGGTIYYDNTIIKKYVKEDKLNYGYFDELKGEMKKDFQKAKYTIQYNERDIAIHNNDALHNGTKNNSNEIRYYLFVIVHTSKSSKIPIPPYSFAKK